MYPPAPPAMMTGGGGGGGGEGAGPGAMAELKRAGGAAGDEAVGLYKS
jgi:hypothetical protein